MSQRWVNSMDSDALLRLNEAVSNLSADVSEFIKQELNRVQRNEIETKSLNSLVSYVDKEAETRLVSGLSKLIPEAGFITEEDTEDQPDNEYVWVVDPLDGTTNFLYRIPHFSISIALMHNNEPVLACVYEVMQDTAYTAVRGQGAWENNKKIQVSHNPPEEALVVTGFPYEREGGLDERLKVLKYCLTHYRGMRRLGSAALDLAYVAAGKFDIYYENTLNIWDIAAGALLVQEAGGLVSDYQGKQAYLQTGGIVASSPHLHPDILHEVSSNLE